MDIRFIFIQTSLHIDIPIRMAVFFFFVFLILGEF